MVGEKKKIVKVYTEQFLVQACARCFSGLLLDTVYNEMILSSKIAKLKYAKLKRYLVMTKSNKEGEYYGN